MSLWPLLTSWPREWISVEHTFSNLESLWVHLWHLRGAKTLGSQASHWPDCGDFRECIWSKDDCCENIFCFKDLFYVYVGVTKYSIYVYHMSSALPEVRKGHGAPETAAMWEPFLQPWAQFLLSTALNDTRKPLPLGPVYLFNYIFYTLFFQVQQIPRPQKPHLVAKSFFFWSGIFIPHWRLPKLLLWTFLNDLHQRLLAFQIP